LEFVRESAENAGAQRGLSAYLLFLSSKKSMGK
jgi:hypothetical protein